MSVGRLTSWKGFYGIIDAIKGEPAWHLTIVGDGPLRTNLESYVRQQDVSDRVRFTGLLPRDELHGWLKTADVFVLNSTYEGLPHVLIEAMSLGTPVVATDIAGNREVLTHEREGLLIPVNDTTALHDVIKKTFTDPETKSRVLRAQNRAKMFAIERTIDGLAKLLKTICVS